MRPRVSTLTELVVLMGCHINEWLWWILELGTIFTRFFTLPLIAETRKPDTIFPRFSCQKALRYRLSSANVNPKSTYVRQKRSRSHTTLSLSLNRFKNCVAAYRYCHGGKVPQCPMVVVAIFINYFLFPDLGDRVNEVRGSKQQFLIPEGYNSTWNLIVAFLSFFSLTLPIDL